MFIVVYLREHSGVLLVPCPPSSSGPGPSWVKVRKVKVSRINLKTQMQGYKGYYKKHFKIDFKGDYSPTQN